MIINIFLQILNLIKANHCSGSYIGCFGCACGDCYCGCGCYRKKRDVGHEMNWPYSLGNVNMNVELCILGCRANGYNYARLQRGYALMKAV